MCQYLSSLIMERLLEKLGLDEKESTIYLACVKHGAMSHSRLSQITGIKRTTVYFYIQKLIELGLIGMKLRGKRKIIVANPISSLETMLGEEKEKIKEREEKLY